MPVVLGGPLVDRLGFKRATTNAVTLALDAPTSPKVVPITKSDSPKAMMTNNRQRSARCPPSTVHSMVRERPRPGV